MYPLRIHTNPAGDAPRHRPLGPIVAGWLPPVNAGLSATAKRRLSALTGVCQPATVLPLVQRQVSCQFFGHRRLCTDSDRHPHMGAAFRDWVSEASSHDSQVAEFALAHPLPNRTEASYARSTLLDKRRRLMADWG